MTPIKKLNVVILVATFSLAAYGAWQEGFEGYQTGALGTQGGWQAETPTVVEELAHSGKKCLKISQPTTQNYTVVARRPLELREVSSVAWLDFSLYPPANQRLVMVEVQKNGKMVAAVGAGPGESPLCRGLSAADQSGGHHYLAPALPAESECLHREEKRPPLTALGEVFSEDGFFCKDI